MTERTPAPAAKLKYPERFWAKVDRGGPEDCWEWRARLDRDGYGYHWRGQRGLTVMAHRIAYVEMIGAIPGGLELDHLCRNRKCVNPEHLEPVTTRVNQLRGETHAARNSAKTHCPHGHPYSGENLEIRAGGRRACRTCRREQKRRWDAARRQSSTPTTVV
jgi:hypothetical protein